MLGRSEIVGKPMALLLMHADATVTVCHSRTRDLAAVTREADVLVAAIGRPGMRARRARQARARWWWTSGSTASSDRALARELLPEPSGSPEFETRGYALVGDVHAPQVRGGGGRAQRPCRAAWGR